MLPQAPDKWRSSIFTKRVSAKVCVNPKGERTPKIHLFLRFLRVRTLICHENTADSGLRPELGGVQPAVT